jgi:hypothetical protein
LSPSKNDNFAELVDPPTRQLPALEAAIRGGASVGLSRTLFGAGTPTEKRGAHSTLDIVSIVVYDDHMATSISENATFLRVVVRKDFLKTIQDYRFANRFESASDAIRALIGHGLLAEGFVMPAEGVPPTAPFPGGAPEIVNGKLVGWSLEL